MSKEKMVFHQNMKLFGVSIPKGTFVRQKEWVGLTDEEIGWLWHNSPPNSHEYARAIEAKLKEKNDG